MRLPVSAAAAWALGAGAVALRLVDHGGDATTSAVVLGGLGAALVVLLRLGPSPRTAAVAALAAIVLGELITQRTVGRVPGALAVLGTVVAWWSLPGPAPTRRPSAGGVVISTVAAVSWVATGSNAATAALLGASVAWWWAAAAAPMARADALLVTAAGRVHDATSGPARRTIDAMVGRGRAAVAAAGRCLMLPFREGNRIVTAAAVAAAVATAPVFHRLITPPFERIRGTNDVLGTMDRIRWMTWWPFRMPVPHPGWTVIVKLVEPVLGEVWAVTVVLAVATAAGAAILVTVGRGRWDDGPALEWPLAVTLGLGYVFLENPAILAPRSGEWWGRYELANQHARGAGYFPLHLWATPTVTLSIPFALALFWSALRLAREAGAGTLTARRRRALVALTVASTLVQPASTLALVPALPAYLLLRRRLDRPTAMAVGRSFVLPGALVVLGQVWFLASEVSPWEQATWLWRPFWSFRHFGLDRPVFWGSFLLVAACAWAGGRRWWTDDAVGLSLVATVVAWGPFLMLEQTGIYGVPDADLGVPLLMAFIFLITSSLRVGLIRLQEVARARAGVPAWAVALVLVLVLMLCAGTVDLLSSGGFIPET